MFEMIRLDEKLAAKVGLEPVVLDRLDDVVAITGPNGGGKTRLLGLIHAQIEQIRKPFERLSQVIRASLGRLSDEDKDVINTELHFITKGANEGESLVFALMTLFLHFAQAMDGRSELPEHVTNDDMFRLMRERFEANVQDELRELAGTIRLRGGAQAALQRGRWPNVVSLSSAPVKDRYGYRYDEPKATALDQFPGQELQNAVLVGYLEQHPDWAPRHGEEIAAAAGFRRTVEGLLGMKLGVADQGATFYATLNDRFVRQDELSAGQRLLLSWAQLIHEKVDDVRDAILLIDEPELHLHPSILVEVIDRLRRLQPAQLWVATHCVPLLASFTPRQIIYMENGRASWAGNRVDRVLEGLLGGGDGVARLRTFLGDAASLAFHQFAAESLVAPRAVDLHEGDPQAEQFTSCIATLLNGDDEVRVLEYAAGSGRLIEALCETPAEHRSRLRYHVCNHPDYTSDADAERCRQHLARMHGAEDTHERYWTHLRECKRPEANKMHAAVLCNVLHELQPQTWPRLMSDLHACLRDDGHLLILEDQRMSEGELPHDRGFLVLDETELRELFRVTTDENARLRYSLAHDGRLSLAEIPREFLVRCDEGSIRNALESLRERSRDEIAGLRRRDSQSSPHQRGRLHAFYALLHTNATLALESH